MRKVITFVFAGIILVFFVVSGSRLVNAGRVDIMVNSPADGQQVREDDEVLVAARVGITSEVDKIGVAVYDKNGNVLAEKKITVIVQGKSEGHSKLIDYEQTATKVADVYLPALGGMAGKPLSEPFDKVKQGAEPAAQIPEVIMTSPVEDTVKGTVRVAASVNPDKGFDNLFIAGTTPGFNDKEFRPGDTYEVDWDTTKSKNGEKVSLYIDLRAADGSVLKRTSKVVTVDNSESE